MSYKINVVIEKDECGYYAYCPELSGCQTQGDSIDEVLINIKEAVELYLETMPKDEIMVSLTSCSYISLMIGTYNYINVFMQV